MNTCVLPQNSKTGQPTSAEAFGNQKHFQKVSDNPEQGVGTLALLFFPSA